MSAKTLSETYRDRNLLAVAFAAAANEVGMGQYRGWWSPGDGDDADADEWAIVYVLLPAGQVSWHVPRDMAEESVVPRKHAAWDGHTRADKNSRLEDYTGLIHDNK